MHSNKAQKLIKLLKALSPVAVALSGGLDSSVVAKAAHLASKESLAVTIDDFTVPRRDMDDAKRVAKVAGITHAVVKSRPPKEVLANPKDRCFYCKTHNYGLISATAKKFGIETVVDGANADDTKEYRPGMKAARDLGVRSPLLELGLKKKDIRELAKEFGLPVWEKPSSACLSSRVLSGERITRGKLTKVEKAEEEIRKLTGLAKVRVRFHGNLARIEVPNENLGVFFDKLLIQRISKRLREIGFSQITLDLEGYRPGGA